LSKHPVILFDSYAANKILNFPSTKYKFLKLKGVIEEAVGLVIVVTGKLLYRLKTEKARL
jgi:hypothetical protein